MLSQNWHNACHISSGGRTRDDRGVLVLSITVAGTRVEFLSEVERAVKSIAASPNTWTILEGGLRRRLTKRSPFGILYRIESAEIVVIAVAHLRRKPGYWKDRIR